MLAPSVNLLTSQSSAVKEQPMIIRDAMLAVALTCSAAVPAFAQIGQTIDPDTLPPAQRESALHGPLYDHGPTGAPAEPGCLWSRIQIPSGQGLKWFDQEECNGGQDNR